MDHVVYTQYYRCKTPDRQQEIDECLRHNLNQLGSSKVVMFKESDALPLEVEKSDARITHPGWFRWLKHQATDIGLLRSANIFFDEEPEYLASSLTHWNHACFLVRSLTLLAWAEHDFSGTGR